MLICFRCLLKLTSFSLSRAPIGPIFVKSHSDRTRFLLLPPVLWALQSPRKFLSISLGGLWWARSETDASARMKDVTSVQVHVRSQD
jgi:hypothetical protein